MRRDLGGEVLVALAVVAVLAFALIFGVILSLSNQNQPPEGTEIAAVESETEVVPNTLTAQPTLSETPLDTQTPPTLVTATPTGIINRDPTATRTYPIPWTATASATRTIALTAVVIQTGIPITVTIPVTASETVELPTRRATTASPTTIVLTASPTFSPSPTLTMTATASPSHTASITITATATPTATYPGICLAPPDWDLYTVRTGDTLYAIAHGYGTSVGALRMFNCLPIDQGLNAGESLHVPPAVMFPVATSLPLVPPAGQTYEVQGCDNINALIDNITPGQPLSGTIDVTGTAALEDFASFRLEVRPLTSDTFDLYTVSTIAINGGVLGQINTADYGFGLHTIRLSVSRRGSITQEFCAIPVIFR